MLSKRYTTFVLAGAAAAALAASTAEASLTYDLVATAFKRGTTITSLGGDQKAVTGVQTGDIIRLKLYATVTGANPSAAQILQSASGSLLSTGPLLGDFKTTRISTNAGNTGTTAHISSPWTANASSVGLAQDLDGDGDMDLGSNTDANSDNFVIYRSAKSQGPKSNNYVDAAGTTFSDYGSNVPTTTGSSTKYVLSQEIDYLVTNAGGSSSLNWRLRAGQSAVWFEDGTETQDVAPNGTDPLYSYSGGTTGSVQLLGLPVVLTGGTVPEPTMLGGVGLAALGMFSRRRRNA